MGSAMFLKKAWNAVLFAVVMAVYLSYVLVGCVFIFVFSCLVSHRKTRCRVAGRVKVLWLHLVRSTLHLYFPGDIFIQYDPAIETSQKNVVVSNHLTEYDWLFVCSALDHFGRFENLCIVLKRSLRNVPLLGYGMEFFGFIFLNRSLRKDEEIIEQGVANLRASGRYDFLLFPEGTYIDRESHKKSRRWAESSGVTVNEQPFNPEEVLVPRTNGYRIIHENLAGDMQGVVDITLMGNPYTKYPQDTFTYSHVVLDKPRSINFMLFIDYIPASEVSDPESLMLELFEEKERLVSRSRQMRDGKKIATLDEFVQLAEGLGRGGMGRRYTAINLSSRWAPLFFVAYSLGLALLAGSVFKLLSK
jgi:lysocardiolipin and lysophospholipid acyltransferase